MPNMAHCRFENTENDLLDCYENMDDDELNQYEKPARERLIKLCVRIAQEYGSLDLGD